MVSLQQISNYVGLNKNKCHYFIVEISPSIRFVTVRYYFVVKIHITKASLYTTTFHMHVESCRCRTQCHDCIAITDKTKYMLENDEVAIKKGNLCCIKNIVGR